MFRIPVFPAMAAAFALAAAPAVRAQAVPPPPSQNMVKIPAGQFLMGSSKAQSDKELTQTYLVEGASDEFGAREKPQHEVKVKAFELSKYLVTRAEFVKFVNQTGYAAPGCYSYNGTNFSANKDADWRNPGYKQTPKDPVVCMSYKDAQAYIKWFSAQTGVQYRLPTEAELEYATRAGTTTSRFWGEDVSKQCEYANGPDETMKDHFPGWYGAPCRDGYLLQAPVGSFKPNPWGLYDMVGEVYELVEDCWHDSYDGAPTDGSAWTTGDCSQRVLRGGGIVSHPGAMTSSARVPVKDDARSIFMGFRLARSLP